MRASRRLAAGAGVLATAWAVAATPGSAEPSASWAWLRVEPAPQSADGPHWTVQQGRVNADIPVKGAFAFELDADDSRLRQHYQVRGEVGAGGRARASEVLDNSDAGVVRYTGQRTVGDAPCLNLRERERTLWLCRLSR